MGNASLRKAILNEQWEDVRVMIKKESVMERIRNKNYIIPDRTVAEDQLVTALHLACSRDPPEDVLLTLLHLNLQSALTPSSPGGELPIHCAVRRAGQRKKRKFFSVEAVRILLDYSDASQQMSQQSSSEKGAFTPLHLACAVRAPCEVIRLLHEADLDSSRICLDAEHRTAWEIAKIKNHWIRYPTWRKNVKAILRGSDPVVYSEELNDEPNPAAPSLEDTPTRNRDRAISEDLTGQGDLCVVCWDLPADHVLIPCGHLCLCVECSDESILSSEPLSGKCPVCKDDVHRPMKVYCAGVPNPAYEPELETTPERTRVG
eukprot:CAMPEP_0198285092 /NCGR_PEP_ID=MMETSP1449-20131203/4409_1 /TAXON_ID=420275 /ORGANISM="Attheya septentrionalis, Strain CCMP2084" /LENGTH=317 /DNA_ID=CAMNT_0043982353 /DNA_START=124 /DNA_END=1077 /DNA_ORIENTATION=+